jgi:hypothetical protein
LLQSTPLRVHKIGAILRAVFCYNGLTIYSAARLKRNMLGRAVPPLFWWLVSMAIVHAACSLPVAAPSRMLTQEQRRRCMP